VHASEITGRFSALATSDWSFSSVLKADTGL
jgi:hypothetical protein